MKTGLERIAEKARKERKLNFTSLGHHLTEELIWESLCQIPKLTATGIDGQSVEEAEKTFKNWVERMVTSVHRGSYRPPDIRRVYIPKPGKTEKRPIGVPCVADRALQRSISVILSAIYEQDFLSCSFGGRPSLGSHNALCTFNEVVAGRKVSWILECDLKDFFGSLDHGWLLRFVTLRVGDPRILNLIKRWLKAGVAEEGRVTTNKEGTAQGGTISVVLSNLYLHYVLDLWFERVIKPRMRGEVYMIRYLDDFVICFQYRSDAKRVEKVLPKRLGKFLLRLEPTKTKLIEFGRFATHNARRRGRKLETMSFLGFTHFCTQNRKGNFTVGRKTEKTRHERCLKNLSRVMQIVRHKPLHKQALKINQVLRGQYAYYGVGGNLSCLHKVYRFTERYWKRMLSTRSQQGDVTWEKFQKIKETFPLRKPKLYVPYSRMQVLVVL